MSLAALVLSACGGGGGSDTSPASGAQTQSGGDANSAPANPSPLSLAAQVGQKLFFDTNLSSNKNQSCASCHDPNYAYGPPNGLSVQLGSDGHSKGQRAAPSLRYKDMTPPYNDVAENPDGATINAPGGGFMLDGRAATLVEQAGLPLLNPVEMNNPSKEAVVQAVRTASYATLFKQAFGASSLDDTETAFASISQAIAAFETEDISFHPYSSKYDLYIGNKVGGALTPAELRGLSVFNRADQGNCAACHFPGANFQGSVGLMTDFTYQAVGAPRNDRSIPNNPDPVLSNDDPAYFDMGLCGPTNDSSGSSHTPGTPQAGAGPDPYTGVYNPNPYCGRFKVPTLRNVASRTAFFHNGVLHSLEQVVRFYNTRDTNPEYWYPATGGSGAAKANPSYALQPTYVPGATVNKFNDLPAMYQGNIDEEAPMGQGQTEAGGSTALNGARPRPAGSTPLLTEQNVQDLLCFLNTLSDGYQPPATAPTSGACVK
ncbi:MAG: cytochrome-c peroxidase [Betaproteobacteria bacterium]|nr:cytochrome-c peroxidase [Betaproteobacteria bacterium]